MFPRDTIKKEAQVSQVDTPIRYPRRVAKPKWTPPNTEIAARIDAAVDAHRRSQEADAEYRRIIAELADADVPIAHIAERIGVQRKTVYRHLGRSMT